MNTFCTILSAKYLPYALALYDSLVKYNNTIVLNVFISDCKLSSEQQSQVKGKNIRIIYNEELCEFSETGKKLAGKYQAEFHNTYRWSMKPILLCYLLSEGHKKVIYVDCDIYFFNDFQFIFNQLSSCNVLLSPHWRNSDPNKGSESFKLNFVDGMFNGGFVGASQGGQQALEYWAQCCLFECQVDQEKGLFADQKYLDILHSRFEGIDVLRHKGCNVANWNQLDCRRTVNNNNEVRINDEFEIVFIHFTKSMFIGALFGSDSLLIPYLDKYANSVYRNGGPNLMEEIKLERKKNEEQKKNKSTLKKIKAFFK